MDTEINTAKEFCLKEWIWDGKNHCCYLDKGHVGPCQCGMCAEGFSHEGFVVLNPEV